MNSEAEDTASPRRAEPDPHRSPAKHPNCGDPRVSQHTFTTLLCKVPQDHPGAAIRPENPELSN